MNIFSIHDDLPIFPQYFTRQNTLHQWFLLQSIFANFMISWKISFRLLHRLKIELMSLLWITLLLAYIQKTLIFILSFLYQHVIKNLYRFKYTFPTKEISNSQLAKNNLVIILNILSHYLLLSIYKLFWCIVCLRIVESIMNRIVFSFCSDFFSCFGPVYWYIIWFFFYV